MRLPTVFSSQRRELDVAMTPMIDVVFLLLVFFVWTASFQIVEYVLPSNVSAVTGSQPNDAAAVPPPEADFDDVVIRILLQNGRAAWQLNGTPIATLAEIRSSLVAIAAVKPDAPVILHPEGDVPLGHVIDVYDVARLEGFEKVQFAASEDI